jgi:prepilin-type N-terminal cleavage/methylation domain-containing protein
MYIIAKTEKGFTLLELIIALAIGALVIGALGAALYQIFSVTDSNSHNLMAIRQVQDAGYWISRDVQQSKTDYITIDDNPGTQEIFTIIWDELDYSTGLTKTGHKTVYRLDEGNLYRDYYITSDSMAYEVTVENYDFSFERTSLIAQYIDDDISLVKGNTVVLTVSSTVEGWKTGTAERIYEIETRVD